MGIATIPTKNALQTTLASSLSAGETGSLSVSDDLSSFLSDASATRPFWAVVDRVDANGTKTPTTREYIKITGVSGTTWSGLARGQGGSSDQAHNAGAVVEIVVDANTIGTITDTFLVEHAAAGTHAFSGTLSIAGTDSASAGVRLAEDTDNGTNYMGLKAPSAVTTSTDLVLPDGDGTADQVLKTDGSGNLGWVDQAEGILSTTQYAPEGFLINGKIVPSVDSNNLTVAIKGMDGNDPSASNPVYVRIENTVYTLTSALTMTRNAGTNYGNAGGAELATKEVDWFVYLVDNTSSSSITLAFSRVPYGRIVSDFTTANATTGNSIQWATGANTTDKVVLIGRFAATLSAGAGYTWTVPTFTNKNLVQKPIYETRWLTWAPTISWTTGTPPSSPATSKCYYKIVMESLHISASYDYNTAGTSNTTVTATLPINEAETFYSQGVYGYYCTTSGAGYGGNPNCSTQPRGGVLRFFGNSTSAAALVFGGVTTLKVG